MAMEPIRLTTEQRVELDGLEEQIVWIEAEIAKAEECGFDVAALKADGEKLKRQREAIYRVYG